MELKIDFQKQLPGGETTGQRLIETLHSIQTERTMKRFPFDQEVQHYFTLLGIDCDEVYPGIYIGDVVAARHKEYLKMLGITHVLNAAEGKRFGFANTDMNYYKDTTIKYLGLPLADFPSTDISKYFYSAATFIDDAISNGGKAFVHCVLGISRSATCVLAYLMIHKGMLAVDAIRTIRKKRCVQPNKGFLCQLAQLDNQLRRQRLDEDKPLNT